LDISNEIDLKVIKKVIKALEKKAVGYETEEITEEYVKDSNNKENLVKKKVSKHYVPADIAAAKLLLEICNGTNLESYAGMTDSELDQEAMKLFNEYKELSSNKFLMKGEEEQVGNG